MKPKEKIMKYLKDFGRKSTTAIQQTCGINQFYAKKYLNELEKEGKIKKQEETLAVYWEKTKDL